MRPCYASRMTCGEPCDGSPAPPRRQDGFVLISVIWIAGLIAVIATAFTISVRMHIRSAAIEASSVRAEGAANGLVRLVAFQLPRRASRQEAATPIPIDGSPAVCRLAAGVSAIVRVQDQGGLVDLNRASPALLSRLIRSLGAAPSDATRAAHALIDYRDSDTAAFGQDFGDEISLVPQGPGIKNDLFQSVDEIGQALPGTTVDLRRLAGLLTIYSRQDGFDPATAPAPLRLLVEKREAEMFGSVSSRQVFSVDVEVVTADSAFRRIAVVSILGEAARPFAVLEWRLGERSAVSAENAGKACSDLYPA